MLPSLLIIFLLFHGLDVEDCVDCGGLPNPVGSVWQSYDYDNDNSVLTGYIGYVLETNGWAAWDWASDLNSIMYGTPAPKYCMSIIEDNQFAVHGELYPDAYGGTDNPCNTNSPDITEILDFSRSG